jgi:hypothetical protein
MRRIGEARMVDKTFGQPKAMHKTPARVVFVKLKHEPDPKRIPATHAEEQHGGSGLIVYDGKEVVARFKDGVDNWWTEEA